MLHYNPYPPAPSAIVLMVSPSGSTYTPINQEINNLVLQFRSGDSQSGQKLLDTFEPLIKKYRNALWFGKGNIYEDDLGRFLSFFNKDKKKALELLRKSVIKDDKEDLDQLLKYCLLQTALKYNKVSAGFKFVLKDEIVRLTKDVSSFRTTVILNINCENGVFSTALNSGGANTKASKQDYKLKTSYTSSATDTEQEALRFVLEGSDLPGFDGLSDQERVITKKVYLDGIDREKVAIELGLTLRQVRRKICKIREKLRQGLSVKEDQ